MTLAIFFFSLLDKVFEKIAEDFMRFNRSQAPGMLQGFDWSLSGSIALQFSFVCANQW